MGLAQISLRPSDITLDNLVCLAQRFRKAHPEWTSVLLLFFSSREAADNWQVIYGDYDGPPPPFDKWNKALRASYFLEVADHEEHLDIMPLGSDGATDDYVTRIDLPIATTPHCRFEMNSRCLLVFERLGYPDVHTRKVSGAVTFVGRIGRNGRMTAIRVAEAHSTPSNAEGLIVREALANLTTWQLDPAPREDAFRITYSYVVDPSVDRELPKTQMTLPAGVTIRGNPPE
jgi:hypothetical protein